MADPRIEVIDWDYAAVLRAKTPAERVAMVSAAHDFAREMLAARVAELHPDWTERQRHREVLRRLLGRAADEYLASCD